MSLNLKTLISNRYACLGFLIFLFACIPGLCDIYQRVAIWSPNLVYFAWSFFVLQKVLTVLARVRVQRCSHTLRASTCPPQTCTNADVCVSLPLECLWPAWRGFFVCALALMCSYTCTLLVCTCVTLLFYFFVAAAIFVLHCMWLHLKTNHQSDVQQLRHEGRGRPSGMPSVVLF